MPHKRAKSSIFKEIEKTCLFCGKTLILKSTRDIERKNYCSYSCRSRVQVVQWAKEHPEHYRKIQVLSKTPEANKKKSQKKEKHPRWIKNRELPRVKKKRPTYESEKFRLGVYERDNFICQHCGARGGKLNAHHVLRWRDYPDLRFDIQNGITLCVECHKKIHSKKRRSRAS